MSPSRCLRRCRVRRRASVDPRFPCKERGPGRTSPEKIQRAKRHSAPPTTCVEIGLYPPFVESVSQKCLTAPMPRGEMVNLSSWIHWVLCGSLPT